VVNQFLPMQQDLIKLSLLCYRIAFENRTCGINHADTCYLADLEFLHSDGDLQTTVHLWRQLCEKPA
jgi:hypothetical protein